MSSHAPDGIIYLGLVGARVVMTTDPGVDPTIAPGVDAPIGSIYLRDSATAPLYSKTGAATTDWTAVVISAVSSGGGLTGDGSDGNVVLGAGTTTLVRDMFYNDLTVPAGSVLEPDGYRVFVRGTLTLAGTIRRDGLAGASVGVPATGGAGVSSVNRPLNGTAGGGNGNAAAGTAGTNTAATPPGYTTSGGAGGAGTNAGGAGGTATPIASPGSGGIRMAAWAITGKASGTASQSGAGPGGGGGGGTFGGPGVGAGGGGGGAGGGYLVVAATVIVDGGGSITANGGAGGAGHGDGAGVTAAGGGGGGGGGIVVVYSGNNVFPTTSANGGAAGAGFSGGAAGNQGPNGQVMLFGP